MNWVSTKDRLPPFEMVIPDGMLSAHAESPTVVALRPDGEGGWQVEVVDPLYGPRLDLRERLQQRLDVVEAGGTVTPDPELIDQINDPANQVLVRWLVRIPESAGTWDPGDYFEPDEIFYWMSLEYPPVPETDEDEGAQLFVSPATFAALCAP